MFAFCYFRANDDYDKGIGRDLKKSNVECYPCYKLSHCLSEYHTRLPNEKEEKSTFVEDKEGETLLMVVHVKVSSGSKLFGTHVNTSCSNNMTESKSYFTNLCENYWSIDSFGDLSIVNVMGKGTISILKQKIGVWKSYQLC